jgi:predicted restriction endonuclease
MRKAWTRSDQLVALHLYLTEPFGRLHERNPRIIDLAKRMGRTPGSVNMKANNFASLDPEFLKTGKKGLPGASASDRSLWSEFEQHRAPLGEEMEAAVEALGVVRSDPPELRSPLGSSEVVVTTKQRRHQRFFRDALLAAYEERCAVTGLDQAELNVASHIIPWSVDVSRRADPTNGLLLSALFDRAFDGGLITFDSGYKMICARTLKRKPVGGRSLLLDHEGQRLRMPERFPPSTDSLRWHREHRFVDR